jgi:hypothetical protein
VRTSRHRGDGQAIVTDVRRERAFPTRQKYGITCSSLAGHQRRSPHGASCNSAQSTSLLLLRAAAAVQHQRPLPSRAALPSCFFIAGKVQRWGWGCHFRRRQPVHPAGANANPVSFQEEGESWSLSMANPPLTPQDDRSTTSAGFERDRPLRGGAAVSIDNLIPSFSVLSFHLSSPNSSPRSTRAPLTGILAQFSHYQ